MSFSVLTNGDTAVSKAQFLPLELLVEERDQKKKTKQNLIVIIIPKEINRVIWYESVCRRSTI